MNFVKSFITTNEVPVNLDLVFIFQKDFRIENQNHETAYEIKFLNHEGHTVETWTYDTKLDMEQEFLNLVGACTKAVIDFAEK